jgi:hypothetical protein
LLARNGRRIGDALSPRKQPESGLIPPEPPATFGVGNRDGIDRVVIQWPSGRFVEHNSLATDRAYQPGFPFLTTYS